MTFTATSRRIADQRGLTRSQVKGRITTMRQLLAEELDDARYISARNVNNVQLGQAWIAHRPEVS